MLRTHVRPLVAGLAFATAATAGYAQQLEEVVVTAQKREQTLSDVPISMSAISGELVQDAAIKSFTELGAYVPNLSITENAVNSIISMRGIGVGAQQSFEQSVGIFVDGVHLGKSRQTRLGLFDLEQVEVLRGPQGILFGKNTLAGAINVRSASPELGGDASARIAVSKESNNGDIVEGWFQTSITDNLAVRLAYRDSVSDGYLTNSFATGSNGATPYGPTIDEQIWRLSAKWQLSDSTVVDIKYMESDFTRIGSTATTNAFGISDDLQIAGIPSSNFVMYTVMGLAFPGFGGDISDLERDSKTIGGNILSGGSGFKGPDERNEGTDTNNEELSINLAHEFDNGMTFNYVYGDSFYDYEDGIDADFLPVEFIGRSDDSDFDQEFHELRFAGEIGNNFSWIAGGNYVDTTQAIDRSVVVDGTLGQPGAVSAVMSAAFTPSAGAAGLIAAVDPTYVTQTPLGLAVNGTPSFIALDPYALLASQTGTTIGQILAGQAPASDWINFGANYTALTGRGFLSDNMGVDGASMALATNRLSYWQQDTKSTAAFFQGTYQVNADWSVTAGVRYTEETKDVVAYTELGQTATGLGNAVTPAQAPFLHGFQASSFATWAHDFKESRSTNQVIPGFSVQYQPDDDNDFYLSYAEGFKSGGFNSVDDQNPAFALDANGNFDTSQPIRNVPGPGFEYDDENASSWEIGGKHRLLDGRMQLNWAAYNSTYEDLQVSTFVGLGFVVANAAEATIQGFEFDVNFQATEKLRLALAMGFNDGSYDSFPGAGCTAMQQNGLRALAAASATGDAGDASAIVGQSVDGCVQASTTQQSQDLGGAQLGTDYNGSAQIEYVQPLTRDMMWFTQIDYNFTDGYFLQGDQDDSQFQDGYGTTNLRTGIRTDNWFLMAYGRNIGDEEFSSGGFQIPLAQGSFARYRANGAVYGIQAAYTF